MTETSAGVSVAERVTGSTNSPFTDGSTRAMFWLLMTGIVNFIAIEVVDISIEGLGALNTIIIAVSYFLGGIFDALIKPMLTGNQ